MSGRSRNQAGTWDACLKAGQQARAPACAAPHTLLVEQPADVEHQIAVDVEHDTVGEHVEPHRGDLLWYAFLCTRVHVQATPVAIILRCPLHRAGLVGSSHWWFTTI